MPFIRVVRDCHGWDLVALLCPARTSVLELLLRALGILEEFKLKELFACIFFFLKITLAAIYGRRYLTDPPAKYDPLLASSHK